jgi:hypothetical protein
MFIRDFTISVGIGIIVLLLLSKLIGRVQFSLSTAFWCSLIGHVFLSISAFMAGVIFHHQLGLALLFSLAIGCFFQAALFQIAVRATAETLHRSRAVILSAIVILVDFLVTSPIIEFGERGLKYGSSALSIGTASLVVAIGLAVVSVVLRPLSDGLLDTSMWVAKILAPSDTEENEATKQLLKVGQAALLEGWLSNIPLMATTALCVSTMAGFIYRWWGGIAVLFASVALGVLAKLLRTRSVSYYLVYIYHRMASRATDYGRQCDLERLEAAESLCEDLRDIILIYQGSRLRPPTPEQIKEVPYGDLTYWLERGAGRA